MSARIASALLYFEITPTTFSGNTICSREFEMSVFGLINRILERRLTAVNPKLHIESV